jgi:hypothetical protein
LRHLDIRRKCRRTRAGNGSVPLRVWKVWTRKRLSADPLAKRLEGDPFLRVKKRLELVAGVVEESLRYDVMLGLLILDACQAFRGDLIEPRSGIRHQNRRMSGNDELRRDKKGDRFISSMPRVFCLRRADQEVC